MTNLNRFTGIAARILDIPSLGLHLRPEWGSQNAEYRDLIKKHRGERLPGTSSVSHAKDLGGYAWIAGNDAQIGFDLEEISRVRSEIARRVCRTEEEFSEAPSFAALWTAKEASFKSLRGDLQPEVVAEIRVGSWKLVEDLWTFQFTVGPEKQKPLVGKGLCGSLNSHELSLAIWKAD